MFFFGEKNEGITYVEEEEEILVDKTQKEYEDTLKNKIEFT